MGSTTHPWLTQQVTDNVATITIDYPPANVLTPQALRELESTFENLARNERIKVIIITGIGRFFIGGADIRVLANLGTTEKARELALTGQNVFRKIENSKKPVIAAINGICLGGGLELALCCHIRVAAENAQLGLPEVNLGIIPGFGGTQRLPRLIGQSKATELILTGTSISAQEGNTLGLLSHVFPSDELMRQAAGLALLIASKGQKAVRAALQAIHKGVETGLVEGLKVEANLFGELFNTEDQQEGMAAFLEKRPPRFNDR